MNLTQLREKAKEQQKAKFEETKKHLGAIRKYVSNENEKIQNLYNKLGEKLRLENNEAMRNQIDIAIERANKEITADYIDDSELYRGLRNHLMGVKK